MIATKFVDTKVELDKFADEKREIIKDFSEKINNNQQLRLACCMAAILYEYKRIEAMPHLKLYGHDQMSETSDGRAKMLIRYIKKNFDTEEINQIANCLNLTRDDNVQAILETIPKIEEFAAPVLEEINNVKVQLKEKFLAHQIEFKHISPVDIVDEKINPSRETENQPRNELMTGVFAASSYIDMVLYVGRAIAGGMIVNNRSVQFPKNPFVSIKEQNNPSKVLLAKPVYAYSLPPERI